MKITRKQLRQIIEEEVKSAAEKAEFIDDVGTGLYVGGGLGAAAIGAKTTGAVAAGPIGVGLAVSAFLLYLGVIASDTSDILEDASDRATAQALNNVVIRMVAPALKAARADGVLSNRDVSRIQRQLSVQNLGGDAVEIGGTVMWKIIPYIEKSDWEMALAEIRRSNDAGNVIDQNELNRAARKIWNATLRAKRQIEANEQSFVDKVRSKIGNVLDRGMQALGF